ncbi:hypothetical protein [[Flexibacter] sp. ATCC 35208]|uniref:hypothetical protein n=1 Tax=[Flexibacter] sp. ATCC 35208 TaxID=1936242 RepID=UPI0009D475CD|nr:hypothetical protein [[Flexibacter] sp. ATCC 35208]OMP76333.1 hypothetical protein BW716_25395 [[Flexibacter] sp. ATCC 35208]
MNKKSERRISDFKLQPESKPNEGTMFFGIPEDQQIKVELGFINFWTGKITPGKFILPNGKVILTYPY